MRHRLIPNFEAEGITTDHFIEQILRDVPVSAEAVNAQLLAKAEWQER